MNETECVLARTDENGTGIWNRTYQAVSLHSAIQTSDDGFLILGTTNGHSDSSDIIMIKHDSARSILWNHTFGGPKKDFVRNVQQTSDNGYLMVGMTSSVATDSEDAWIIRANSMGEILWNKTYGGSGRDTLSIIESTNDGGFILLGNMGNPTGDHGKPLLIRTNEDGQEQWERVLDLGPWISIRDVKQLNDGGFLLIGTFRKSYTCGVRQCYSYDILLLKMNRDGKKEWERRHGFYNGDHSVNSGWPTRDGGAIIIGSTQSEKTNGHDIFILKVKDSGYKEWVHFIESQQSDRPGPVWRNSEKDYTIFVKSQSSETGITNHSLIEIDVDINGTLNQDSFNFKTLITLIICVAIAVFVLSKKRE